MSDPGFQLAKAEQDRRDQISNSTLATVLSMILMPAGTVMDFFIYPEQAWSFLKLRFLASLLVGLVWGWFLATGRKHYRVFGVMWYLIPALSIQWMIYAANRPDSPYYAGLNIVLLAVGLLSPWTYKQNMVSGSLVILIYAIVCCCMKTRQTGDSMLNNLYFLILTAVIVTAGSVAQNRLRAREFELRWELDKNRRVVEENNRKLVELDQIKGRFFANISHELRTPLTLLLSPLETMLHSVEGRFDAEARNLMSLMHANGMRLLKLINDLLDLVRLESGRMDVKLEPVELGAFVNGLMGAARQMADSKGLKLEARVQPGLGPVLVDRDKLEKTVLNLVFNALKFTPAGGRVDVRVEARDENCTLTVSDTGVGISARNLPFVFDRFWQADNSSKRKYQGVGIGLSLVKELTEVQGGTVSVQSEEGKGTTFTIDLPMRRGEALTAPSLVEHPVPAGSAAGPKDLPATGPGQSEEWLTNLYRRAELFPTSQGGGEASASAATAADGGRPTLLVADDEPDMRRFLASQLSAHYQVLEAADGAQAVAQAGELLPDIILLDMNMPEKDGLQVCRELRQHAPTRGIPIILLTARADEQTKLAALSAGANDFLTKPFSSSELHVRIRNLVDAHHSKQKLARQNQTLEGVIDQLKETETLLVQTEKIASLGRMSAGIIHEINNPLNYATTGLFSLRNKARHLAPEHQAEYEEILKDVEEGIDRVKGIVSSLKTFTHPNTEQLDLVEIHELTASALKFLSNEWKDKVVIHLQFPAHLPVRGNRNKLLQVFVNLLLNSLEATRRKTYSGEQPAIRIEGTATPARTVITIHDNGEGIDAKALDKIFDPFFTTKDVGEGMGLGLSICYRIMQEYDGRISARSEAGKFCEFRLEFPTPETSPAAGQTANGASHEQRA